jgi:hypothetical protein
VLLLAIHESSGDQHDGQCKTPLADVKGLADVEPGPLADDGRFTAWRYAPV